MSTGTRGSSRRQKSIHEFFPTSTKTEHVDNNNITAMEEEMLEACTGDDGSIVISPPTPVPKRLLNVVHHHHRPTLGANCKLMFDSQSSSRGNGNGNGSSVSSEERLTSSQKMTWSQSSVTRPFMLSQEDLMLDDFLTPQDQPVVHLQHPNSPSPIKKRYRLSTGRQEDQDDRAVAHLTKDMVVLGFQQGKENGGAGAGNGGAGALTALLSPSTAPSSSSIVPEININPFLVSTKEEEEEVAEKRKRKSGRRRNHHPPSAYFTPQLAHGIPQQQQSKYLYEFVQVEMIGQGSFSQVFKCIKRLDGWTYAIKKFKRHLRGRNDLNMVLREVFALAALGPSDHVIRYYNAWIEDDLLYIQLEYCPGGSLVVPDVGVQIEYSEDQLRQILCHMATALLDIHQKKIVHLDIKPSNILISSCASGILHPTSKPTHRSSSPSHRKSGCMGSHNSTLASCHPIKYKLADFGNASRYDNQSMNTVEGDNRYLSRELLEGQASDLRAGDIFALGASIYELALGRALPGQGQAWQRIRDGDLTTFPQYSSALQHLIAGMMHPDPLQRPRAEHILDHEAIRPPEMRWS